MSFVLDGHRREFCFSAGGKRRVENTIKKEKRKILKSKKESFGRDLYGIG